MASELDQRLAALAAPLTTELERVERELAEIDRQRASLSADRTRINSVLGRLNGTGKPGPKPGKGSGAREQWAHPSADRMEQVRAVLREWDQRHEFNRAALVKRMGNAMSHDTVSRAVLTMHADGELQLLKKTSTSGAKLYRYLGSD